MKGLAPAMPLLVLAACASVPEVGAPLTGSWGGAHVGLILGEAGGTLEYDCASGRIGPVVPRPDGTFGAVGSHTPGTGGPERIGEVPPTYEARYSGRVRGDTMTLQVAVANGAAIGPLTLERGAKPIILRCL